MLGNKLAFGKNEFCRFCKKRLENQLIDLGNMPLANNYLTQEKISEEKKYPLFVMVCDACFLVQLGYFVNPEIIFTKYAYASSYSSSWLQHAEEYAYKTVKKLNLGKDSLVVELGSNDGYLLQYFTKQNIRVLGIEPAANIAEQARRKDIDTISEFFDHELARELASRKQADLIIANNVFAHIPGIHSVVAGFKLLLGPEGVITIEAPHLLNLLANKEFDTIYHEHYYYYSLLAIEKIMAHYDLQVFDVETLSTHGGSLRFYIQHRKTGKYEEQHGLMACRELEYQFGMHRIEVYQGLHFQAEQIKQALNNFLEQQRIHNRKVIAYGAPAKGNTLLNFCNITTRDLLCTIDKNPLKQNKFLPGTHIPVYDFDKIAEYQPEYVLILPWNIKHEIMADINKINTWGVKFITPIPELKVEQGSG
ncbi:MAG: methyltransferase domain-containing protein [Gammaproteobacteria bacterium]